MSPSSKRVYRRPQIGDQVEFQLVNNAPKLSASTAQLLGVEPNKVIPFSMLLSAVFIGIVGAGFYLFGIDPTLNPEYETWVLVTKVKLTVMRWYRATKLSFIYQTVLMSK